MDLPEIQSLDLTEIVDAKVRAAYQEVGVPVLVEDVSLTIHHLGKLPGPLIKWFLQELKTDGILKLLKETDDRTATASVQYGYFDGTDVHHFRADVIGELALTVQGENGFGFDPIFIPSDETETWATMSEDDQARTSMRKIALEKFAAHLAQTN